MIAKLDGFQGLSDGSEVLLFEQLAYHPFAELRKRKHKTSLLRVRGGMVATEITTGKAPHLDITDCKTWEQKRGSAKAIRGHPV